MSRPPPRASMAVTSNNTNNLLARFEAMKKSVQPLVDQQKAATYTKTTSPSKVAVPPPVLSQSAPSQPAKASLGSQRQPTPSQMNQTSPRNNISANPPKKEVVVLPVDSDDEFKRVAPLHKPKPDANRRTMAPSATPDKLAEKMMQMQLEEEAKEKAALAASQSSSLFGSLDFQVDAKFRINYDELEFDQMVSSGSAGEVYLGYYYGTPVAIKKLFALASDERHLVAREFSMLQGVNHPNVVQFLGICDHTSGIYLITEYVEHGDLFDMLIFGEEEIEWKKKVRIALQVATAVYYLHSRNIIHRDLKSQNILIGESNKVKLCDLGLATMIESRKRMTVCGTDEWMAPEIILGDRYDSKVDVFSFGIVITEMVTNQPPKKRSFDKQLAFDEQRFRESAPEDCPPEFIDIAVDCTRFDPSERPAFKEIVARLKKLNEAMDD